MNRKFFALLLFASLISLSFSSGTTPNPTDDDDDDDNDKATETVKAAGNDNGNDDDDDDDDGNGPDFYEEDKEGFKCNFIDTINITAGNKNSDGSITYNDIRYAEQHYKIYGYIYSSFHKRVAAPKHIRGCICKYQICIRSCCQKGEDFVNNTCIVEDDITLSKFKIDIHDDGDVENHDLYDDDEFEVTYGQSCKGKVFNSKDFEEGEWFLEKDGLDVDLIITDTKVKYEDFCIATNEEKIFGVACSEPEPDDEPDESFILAFGLVIAVVLLSTTFVVYVYLEEFRVTFHGKLLMSYVLTLALGYISLAAFEYEDDTTMLVDQDFIFDLVFILFIACLFWTLILNFHIWSNHCWRKTAPADEQSVFIKYCAFCWIIPAFVLFILTIIDVTDGDFADIDDFFYVWIFLFLFIVNLIFIILALYGLKTGTQTSASITPDDIFLKEEIKLDNQKLTLHIWLFSYQSVSFAIQLLTYVFYPTTFWYIVVNIILPLHGFLVFKDLVWRPCINGSKEFNITGPKNKTHSTA